MSSRRNSPTLMDRGTVIAGRYRIDDCLAWGGMGVIYAATHVELGSRLALKFLRSDLATDREATERFLDEARIAATLRSEHVAHVLDFGHHDGLPYMVLEYLEGVDLWTLVDERGVLPIPEAVDYIVQACAGLAEVHAAGIVHRDLKPENLFVANYPDGRSRVKVLDFGVSKRISCGRRLTRPKKGVGSPLYMSPEQMRARPIDGRADVWALGTVLYELLTGQLPFDAESVPEICNRVLRQAPLAPRRLRPELPPQLEAVLLHCLEKDRNRRVGDVAELAAALAPLGLPQSLRSADEAARILGHSIPLPPPMLAPARQRVRRRAPGLAVAAAAAAVALIGALGARSGKAPTAPSAALVPPERAHSIWFDIAPLRFASAQALPEREDESRAKRRRAAAPHRVRVAATPKARPVSAHAEEVDVAPTLHCPPPAEPPSRSEEPPASEPPKATDTAPAVTDLPVAPLPPAPGAWQI